VKGRQARTTDTTPDAAGILFELPGVVAALDLEHPRMTALPGDFFVDALPAADAYVLMEVLHDWADDECVMILRAIRRAARVGATVLVVEGVLDEDRSDPRTGTLDVIMLAVHRRTGAQPRGARRAVRAGRVRAAAGAADSGANADRRSARDLILASWRLDRPACPPA
jgi:hypothetical protein